MNDDGKSYLKQLKDIRFIMFDICRCTIEGLSKAFDEIKESLERLEKLEKVVNDFLEYLSKEPNSQIPKHPIKQTLDKLLNDLLGNENS